MKNNLLKILTALLFVSFSASAREIKGGPGQIPEGLTIPNARYVGDSKNVIRGHAPAEHAGEFPAARVTHVLIIKNQVKTEVDEEIAQLVELGLSQDHIHHIAYRWKDLDPLVSCEQTVEALDYIAHMAAVPSNKLYFHCTAGVDRTGLVAALYRLQNESQTNAFQMFKDEMCAHGYGDATYFRPNHVKEAIHVGLTPLYIKLAHIIIENRKAKSVLSKDICQPNFFQSPSLEKKVTTELAKYKCR
ncbi:MAG: tyrosine-protein phosphatase [Bdellovibrionota bacterium]